MIRISINTQTQYSKKHIYLEVYINYWFINDSLINKNYHKALVYGLKLGVVGQG